MIIVNNEKILATPLPKGKTLVKYSAEIDGIPQGYKKEVTGTAVAKCNPEDRYNAPFGAALAEIRAIINAYRNYERWLISKTMKKSWKLNPGPKVKFPNKIGTTPPGLNFIGDLIYGKGTDRIQQFDLKLPVYLTRAGIEKLEKLLNKGGDK